jgi:hypothetical protein
MSTRTPSPLALTPSASTTTAAPTTAPLDPAALAAAVEQVLGILASARASLAITEPPLTSKQKRRSIRRRKGARHVAEIGTLAKT